MKLIINTDGASRGNPGPASYGYAIKDQEGKIIYQEGKVLGVTTNNVAEYMAVLSALEYVEANLSNKLERIEIVTDSQLIASQLSGRYKIKSPHLREIFWKIKDIEERLKNIFYRNVPREE